ncbi:hypothetical protein [Klebsiella grimontii]|uniref:hypothetical protein n=1 Tax=Klebsiella grimontii TaxID=2058152 RepID=UPI001043EF49|nr:hypothetical protein [Klebsiella grimontii]EBS4636329.1 hypothetical protein [Salmonella enterica subsp. enterica serovar Bareilly]TCZ59434.1 hypothetical protein E0D83_15170 [Klebsiella grimontii]
MTNYIYSKKFWDDKDFIHHVQQENNELELLIVCDVESNFSFSSAEAHRLISLGSSTVNMDSLSVAHLKINFENKKILKNIRLNEIILKSYGSRQTPGPEKYQLQIAYSLFNCQGKITSIIKKNETTDSETKTLMTSIKIKEIIGQFSEDLIQLIKIVFSSHYFNITIVPSTYNQYMKKESNYLRLVQKTEGVPTPTPLHPNNEDFIKSFKKRITQLSKINKKYRDLFVLFDYGLHLEKMGLFNDAYIAYYKIIESCFKEANFLKHWDELNQRPRKYIEGYTKIIPSMNQKMMMFTLYEMFSSASNVEQDKFIPIENFLNVAEIRNKLSHTASITIPTELYSLCRVVSYSMLDLTCFQANKN